MKQWIFLLGRPGCGKSVVYRIASEKLQQKGIKTQRVDDFLTLKKIFDADTEFKKHIRKDGGFAVTDWSVLDEALVMLNNELKKMKKPDTVIFVEFARDNYEKAMKNFDSEILSESLIFYVYCTYEECYRRNIDRFEKAKKSGHDDHIVPLHLMETYYRTDDFEKMYLSSPEKLKLLSSAEIIVIDSSITGEETLYPQIEKVIDEKYGF
ncbi:MAG: AAA family ATPase [Elusimicrobiota bacterium]